MASPYDGQYRQYQQLSPPPNYPSQSAPTYSAPIHNPEAPLENGQTSKVAKNYNPKPKYQDLWASILFGIHLIGFAVLSCFSIKKFLSNSANASALSVSLDGKAILILAFTIIFAFILSIIYLLLMQRFPKPLIKITFVISVLLYIAAAAYYAYLKLWVGTIIFAIFAVLYALSYYFWKSRIPFATLMLETVTAITRMHFGTIVISIAALILQVLYSVWWIITFVGAFQLFDTNNSNCKTTTDPNTGQPTTSCVSAVFVVVMVFTIFSFYWTSMVIKTVLHVTVSGVFASQYFLKGTPFMPKSPTISSFGRAVTTSFGSICFGSLLIAIIQTIKALLRAAINNQGNDNACCVFFSVCALCLLNCIGDLFEYFNYYAYTEVAIYGKPYCKAAKDTWALIKDRGVEAIINDNLIGNVLGAGVLLIGILSGLFAFGVLSAEKPPWNANGQFTWVFIVVGVLVGAMTSNVVTGVISSGVATTFVALAEDPAALSRSDPALYAKVVQTWPRVVQGI